MFTRTLKYMRSSTATPFIREALTSDQMATYNQIVDLRSKADGFQGEVDSVSDDQLEETFVSTWADEASYMAFYNANKALIDQHTADKLTYSALQFVGYADTRKSV